MASATILGEDIGTGAWGAYGAAGYSIFDFATVGGSMTQWLPPTIVALDYGRLNAIWQYPDTNDDRCIRLPGGPKYATTRGVTSPDVDLIFKFTAASESTRWRASLRLCAAGSGRPATVTIRDAAETTALASVAAGDLWDGRWVRFEATGSVTVRVVGTYPRTQGVLYDAAPAVGSPGRLLCFESGRSGLIG